VRPDVANQPARADARRNRERVLAAAAVVLSESGLKAPVEDIARRAGVGVGTVCRHFPTKQALVDAVLTTLYEELLRGALGSLAIPDPGEGFEQFVVVLSAFQARHRVLAEHMARAVEAGGPSVSVRRKLRAAISELVARAQGAGRLRADVGPADVALMFSGVAHATAQVGDVGSDLAERYRRIILDGLRPSAASPLPGEALDFHGLERRRRRPTGGRPTS
jgi:AcrR family transcriptional regulator